MQNLFQGGQCTPGVLNAQSNNFKRLMDLMMMGNSNPQKLLEMAQNGLNMQQQIMTRQMIFQKMNQAWAIEQYKAMKEGRLTNPQFVQQKIHHQQNMQNINKVNMMQQQMIMRQQMMAQAYMQNQMAQVRMMSMARETQLKFNQQKEQQIQKISSDQQQQRIKNATNNMLNLMMDDPDPRFKNSKFLHFLKQINSGDLIIKDKQLIEVKKTLPQTKIQSSWQNSKQIEKNIQNLQKQFMQSSKLQGQSQKMIINQMPEVSQEKQIDVGGNLNQTLKNATRKQQKQLNNEFNQKYIFDKNNPYLQVEQPIVLAIQYMNKGKNNEAILALEAVLQKDQNNAKNWRLLGKLLQQNDQDQKSINCFLNANKLQPTNLDTLLTLVVSCTNILDEIKVINFLKNWIINNPKYQSLNINPDLIPQDIQKMNDKMIQILKQGLIIDQNDSSLLQALASLYFIKRQYQIASDLFAKAGKLQPTNYTIWNKIGVSLAHLGHQDEAIQSYHKAVQIRPSYVKAWVKLGIAYGLKELYEQAARFYLNALSFRRDAKHIWQYLQSCFMSMQRYDLIKLISTQDPSNFEQFDVMLIGDLPQLSIDYGILNQKYTIKSSQPLTSAKQ